VVERLETRGLITRSVSAQDRRVRLLEITDAGIGLLQTLVPHMLQAQERLLAPLSSDERHTFMTLLQRLVTANNDHSRAPANTLPPKTAENRANA
jgi:DNA-binding MarR family transcriptional regulator